MNTFTVIFLIALVISYAIQFWLSMRQKSYVLSHRNSVPQAFSNSVSFAERITLDDHHKAADYTVEKGKLGDFDSVIGIIFLLLLTLGGGISLAFEFWSGFDLSPMASSLAAVATIFLVMTIVEIPTSLYQSITYFLL